MTETAYAKGSTFPELAADKLRLYSMRFCPFTQRTRLVLSHLNVPYEVINVNLKSKPDWFLARNPLGEVPTLEQRNKIITESAICDEYLEELHGNYNLFPADPYEKAKIKILMERFSKVTDKFFTLLFKARLESEENKQKALEELQKALEIFENKLSGKYFGGDTPNMLDLHSWPWYERIPVLEKIVGVNTVISAEKFPKLSAWVQTMHQLPAVQATKFSDALHEEYFLSELAGGPVNYDAGI
jgi:glutathione S-transferase